MFFTTYLYKTLKISYKILLKLIIDNRIYKIVSTLIVIHVSAFYIHYTQYAQDKTDIATKLSELSSNIEGSTNEALQELVKFQNQTLRPRPNLKNLLLLYELFSKDKYPLDEDSLYAIVN